MKTNEILTRPDILLRAEALLALVVILGAYASLFPRGWLLFALLFLVPDVSLLGFVRGQSKIAASIYNLVHSSTLPLILGALAWHWHEMPALRFSLIWLAHIALDRALGFGLKYTGTFKTTHIQMAASYR